MQLSFLHLISNLNCFLVPFHFEREAGVSSSRRFTADKACEKTGQNHNNHKNLAAASLRLACSGVGSLKSLDSIILSHLYTIRLRITPRSLHYLVTHINHTRFDIVINSAQPSSRRPRDEAQKLLRPPRRWPQSWQRSPGRSDRSPQQTWRPLR